VSGPAYSVQSQLLDAVVGVLAALDGAPAYRCRVIPFNPGQLPAYNVFPDEAEPQYEGAYSGSVKWSFLWRVRCIVTGNDGVDKLADPLFVAGSAAILADPTLGGLALTTRFAGVKWEKEAEGLESPLALVVTFKSEFATSRSNPSVSLP